jgi:Domain of unknown function (DUF1905)
MLREFDAQLQKGDTPGAWTCVVMHDAAELFGTRGLVKIRGAIDGEPFAGALMARRRCERRSARRRATPSTSGSTTGSGSSRRTQRGRYRNAGRGTSAVTPSGDCRNGRQAHIKLGGRPLFLCAIAGARACGFGRRRRALLVVGEGRARPERAGARSRLSGEAARWSGPKFGAGADLVLVGYPG